MKRYVVIATAGRGVVDPPELLNAADQWEANMAAVAVDQVDMDTLMRRATRPYQAERDPLIRPEEDERLKKRAQAERSDLERCWRGVVRTVRG